MAYGLTDELQASWEREKKLRENLDRAVELLERLAFSQWKMCADGSIDKTWSSSARDYTVEFLDELGVDWRSRLRRKENDED